MQSEACLLLVDKSAVEALLLPDDVTTAVREAFTLHSEGEGRVFPVVREALSTGGIFGIKSGDVQSQSLLGFKAAGFWRANRTLGGEPHQATIMLFDPATGRPVCVIDGNAPVDCGQIIPAALACAAFPTYYRVRFHERLP